MQFMKQQNSEDYEDTADQQQQIIHCHVSDLESQEEAVVSMNNCDCSDDEINYQIQEDEFDECLPNVIKNTDLVVQDSEHVMSQGAEQNDGTDDQSKESIQFVEDLEEIVDAENDLYYSMNSNVNQNYQQQFQRQLFKGSSYPNNSNLESQEYDL